MTPPTHATGLWRRLRDSLDGCEEHGPDVDKARGAALELREWLLAGGDFPHGQTEPYVDWDRRAMVAYLTGVVEYRGAVRG
jgi:hypothetical protein